jgi:pimeloyl-ACP methyl ester carboxylesterase/DNA-binding CsgD family transcriptional regulator
MQPIRYLTASDGAQIAWTAAGSGSALVRAANWLTHLQYDADSPVWRHWVRFFDLHFRYIRYDERGCGLSDRRLPPDLSLQRFCDDLDDVVRVAAPDERPVLLGISQGVPTAIAYAVRHPERVSRLILYGGFATGTARRGDAEGLRLFQAIVGLIRTSWGSDHPLLRQVFTARFVPDASAEELDRLTEICRRSITPETAANLVLALAELDVRELLAQVRVPTLIVHASRDASVPLAAARELATGIPGAEFVQLESRNHILLEREPAWRQFQELVLAFTGPTAGDARARFTALTPRERAVLGALAAGRSNAEIAADLKLSDKTVRNMLTRVFDKLGVRSRSQAIVLARDQGFEHRSGAAD